MAKLTVLWYDKKLTSLQRNGMAAITKTDNENKNPVIPCNDIIACSTSGFVFSIKIGTREPNKKLESLFLIGFLLQFEVVWGLVSAEQNTCFWQNLLFDIFQQLSKKTSFHICEEQFLFEFFESPWYPFPTPHSRPLKWLSQEFDLEVKFS